MTLENAWNDQVSRACKKNHQKTGTWEDFRWHGKIFIPRHSGENDWKCLWQILGFASHHGKVPKYTKHRDERVDHLPNHILHIWCRKIYKLYMALYTLYMYIHDSEITDCQHIPHEIRSPRLWRPKVLCSKTLKKWQDWKRQRKKRPCRSLTYPWRIYWWCGPGAGAIETTNWMQSVVFLSGIPWAYPCPTSEKTGGQVNTIRLRLFRLKCSKAKEVLGNDSLTQLISTRFASDPSSCISKMNHHSKSWYHPHPAFFQDPTCLRCILKERHWSAQHRLKHGSM